MQRINDSKENLGLSFLARVGSQTDHEEQAAKEDSSDQRFPIANLLALDYVGL